MKYIEKKVLKEEDKVHQINQYQISQNKKNNKMNNKKKMMQKDINNNKMNNLGLHQINY